MRISDWSSDVCSSDLPRFTVMHPELNLLDRDQYEGPLQELCIAEGIGVIPYYSLAAGYLTGKYRGADDLCQSARGHRSEEPTSELQSLMRISYAVYCLRTKRNSSH